VDKIFKAAKPADLPVEQPTQYEFCDQSQNYQADRISHVTQWFGKSRSSHSMIRQAKICVSRVEPS
jgi:hypothetical protein